ncbi:RNA polymerase sigma factor [Brevibacillus choshinensis]|uniref:RNA polymerase sigma factor n=1 Tax=Brevibacillus choshinensis TaxID=54911 RepID=A0ABX7FLU6_BRECH|nr:RNA polymerase sigma factor [Brevibacillus choshinensis]QRG67216.1 RNA polymerase sigma factor [Brevibacillus choshinensis]
MDKNDLIEQWFLRYGDDIYKFLVYYTGSRDVDDLVQDVFLKALGAAGTFEGRSQPKTWLLTIARHTAIDHARKKRLRSWLPDMWLTNLISAEKTPEELIDLQEEQQALYRAIQQVRPAYREVLILRGIKGLSAKETAQILNWSENKVNVTLHRAMKAVKDKLELEGKELIGNAI